ncbi:MAG: hypothetical protein AB1567_05515 [bacterium]
MAGIRIFSLTGEGIYDKNVSTTTDIWDGWDLRNKDNDKVASGIYIYVITSPDGDKKVGKVGVVR